MMPFWTRDLKFCTVVRTRSKSFGPFRLVSVRLYAPNEKTFTAYFFDVQYIGSFGFKPNTLFRRLALWLDPWDGTDTVSDEIMCRETPSPNDYVQ